MVIRLYRYTKRFNSTKHPDLDTDSGYTEHHGNLKENCSIITPQIRFQFDDSATSSGDLGSPIRYNYMYINIFKRFYFIRNWVWEGPFWVAICEEDYLGSWKSPIGSGTQYIERCAGTSPSTSLGNYTVGDVIDSQYPATSKIATTTNTVNNPFSARYYNSIAGILLGYISGNYVGTVVPGAVYGRMDLLGWTAFNTGMFSNVEDVYGITTADLDDSGVSESVLKALLNPLQYIVSCRAFPLSLTDYTDSAIDFKLGWWDVSAFNDGNIYPIKSKYITLDAITVSIPKHPQASSRGGYLNTSAYAGYELTFEPFGTLSIPNEFIKNASTLTINVRIDVISGNAYMRAIADNAIVATATANIAIDIPIGQITQDLTGAGISNSLSQVTESAGFLSLAGGALGSVGAALTGNVSSVLSSASQVTSAMTSYMESVVNSEAYAIDAAQKTMPTLTTVGSASGSATIFGDIRLTGRFKYIVNKDSADEGLPYYSPDTISNHSGYIKCRNTDTSSMYKEVTIGSSTFTVHSNADEQIAIKKMMDGGFFYD